MACAVSECTKPGKLTRGWCPMHYQRWRQHGDLAHARPSVRRPVRQERRCRGCGVRLPDAYPNRQWHSASCRWQALYATTKRAFVCAGCGITFTTRWKRRYHDKGCAVRSLASKREAIERERQAVAGPTHKRVRVDLGDIGTRDSWICHLCHEPVDPTLTWPDQRMATLDHLIPLAAGGRHEPGNVAIAHCDCNVRRKTAPVSTVPRDWPIELIARAPGTGSVYQVRRNGRWTGYFRVNGRKRYLREYDTAAEVDAELSGLQKKLLAAQDLPHHR